MSTSQGRAAPVNAKRLGVTAPQATALDARYRETLRLWLRWNEAYEQVTHAMCRPGETQERLEQLMDEMDQLRQAAIAQSLNLLN
jgi:hypothetical protein